MKVTATQQAQTQQAETPLHIMPIVEARQKEIALPDSTGAFEKAVETGVSALKTSGRFGLSVVGALGRTALFLDVNSPVLGYKASNGAGYSEADPARWRYDWRLYSTVRR